MELVFQNKEALSTEKLSGAALSPRSNIASDLRSSMSVGTIACVTGFLVNLLKRKVMLITPTLANENWPKGYRILKEATFTGVDGFERLIDDMLRDEVHCALRGDDIIKLNDHLSVEQSDPKITIKGRRHEIEIESREPAWKIRTAI